MRKTRIKRNLADPEAEIRLEAPKIIKSPMIFQRTRKVMIM